MDDRCRKIVRDLVDRIDKSEFRSETDVRRGIVDPLLQQLGWPLHRPRVVEREYTVEGGRVDYALCDHAEKPLAFVEAKKPGGVTDAGRQQLFRYCAVHGVPMAVLTDGRTWNFYLPLRRGRLDERSLPQIALSSDAAEEACRILHRYLERSVVTSEKNVEAATHDLENVRFERACKFAWRELVEAPADGFVRMFEEQVRKKVSTRRSDDVRAWIQRRARAQPLPPLQPPRPPPVDRGDEEDDSSENDDSPPNSGHYIVFRGETKKLRFGWEVLAESFKLLQREDPDFCQKYSKVHYGYKKVWVAESGRGMRAPAQLLGGWYVETSLGTAQKIDRIRKACDVAGIEFGKDLIVGFPGGHS